MVASSLHAPVHYSIEVPFSEAIKCFNIKLSLATAKGVVLIAKGVVLMVYFINSASLSGEQHNFSTVVLSICLMLLWALCFTVAMALAKLISSHVPSLMILFFRCFFGFLFFVPFAAKVGIKGLQTQHPFLHSLRVIFTASAIFCTYYAYRHLPLVTASAIGFTSPLFTTVFAFLLLGEQVSSKKWLAILAGYLGVLVILRPFSFHFGKTLYIALLANMLASSSLIVAKKLTSTESTVTLLFYANAAIFLLSAVAVVWVWQTPSLIDICILAGIGLAGVLSQYLYIEALKIENPSFLAPLEYTRLIFATLVGTIFFHERFDLWSIIGALIIILATFSLSRLEMQAQNNSQATSGH